MFEAELINPFLEAAFEVIDSLMAVNFRKQNASAGDSSMTSQEVNVLIGLVGDTHGQIVYGMSQATAKQIASKMMEQPVRILNNIAQSAIGELGNMITGHAAAKIEEQFPNIELQPPAIVIGENMLIAAEDIRRIYITLASEIGNIEVSIAFSEKEIPNFVSISHHCKTTLQQLA